MSAPAKRTAVIAPTNPGPIKIPSSIDARIETLSRNFKQRGIAWGLLASIYESYARTPANPYSKEHCAPSESNAANYLGEVVKIALLFNDPVQALRVIDRRTAPVCRRDCTKMQTIGALKFVLEPAAARERLNAMRVKRLSKGLDLPVSILEWEFADEKPLAVFGFHGNKWVLPRPPAL